MIVIISQIIRNFFLNISGSSMTGEALAKIGQFLPRLEKVYLDDIFTDSNYILDRYIINIFTK